MKGAMLCRARRYICSSKSAVHSDILSPVVAVNGQTRLQENDATRRPKLAFESLALFGHRHFDPFPSLYVLIIVVAVVVGQNPCSSFVSLGVINHGIFILFCV